MSKRHLWAFWSLTASLALASQVIHHLNIRINITDSAPIGLWHVSREKADFRRSDLVEVCPPPAPAVSIMHDRGLLQVGPCTDDTTSLLKVIGAIEGDHVTVRKGENILVNGQELTNTSAVAALPSWPAGDLIIPAGHVWLVSTYSAGSFDSRYFGPVPVGNILGVASPVLVSGNVDLMRKGVRS